MIKRSILEVYFLRFFFVDRYHCGLIMWVNCLCARVSNVFRPKTNDVEIFDLTDCKKDELS